MRFFWGDNKTKPEQNLRSNATLPLLLLIAEFFSEAIKDINDTLEDKGFQMSVGKPFKTNEILAGNKTAVTRLSISNSHMVLSIRASDADGVQAFLLPAAQQQLVPISEYSSRLKFKLLYQASPAGWSLDGKIINENDLRLLVLALTNDILKYSQAKIDSPQTGARLKIGELSLTTGLRGLLFEKAQLLADLLTQQESIHSHIAEELHDSVITDLLLVQRDLTDGREIHRERMRDSIEEIISNLREICTEFSSRDIKDWGLWQALCNLVERLANRTSQNIEISNTDGLPKMPYDIAVQIYRVVQESLNNAIKHAKANEIKVNIIRLDNELALSVEDDGVGFDLAALSPKADSRLGGMGIPLLKERTDRLSALGYPCTITIDSSPGSGTQLQIRIDISAVLKT